MNTLVFDIETIPDVEFGRQLYGLDGLSDAAVARAMQSHAQQKSGSDFLPLLQHRIVAISCAFRSREGFRGVALSWIALVSSGAALLGDWCRGRELSI